VADIRAKVEVDKKRLETLKETLIALSKDDRKIRTNEKKWESTKDLTELGGGIIGGLASVISHFKSQKLASQMQNEQMKRDAELEKERIELEKEKIKLEQMKVQAGNNYNTYHDDTVQNDPNGGYSNRTGGYSESGNDSNNGGGYVEPSSGYTNRKIDEMNNPENNNRVAYIPRTGTEGTEALAEQALSLRNEGFDHYQNTQYQAAVDSLSRAIKLNPEDSYSFFYRGASYLKLKAYDLSISDLQKSIELNPRYSYAHSSLGAAYLELKDFGNAIRSFSMAVQLNPNDANAYSNLGAIYLELKDFENTVGSCSRAIQINPNNLVAYYNRGVAYMMLKQYQL
jgi:tetratricopeptide (TPR) repeat protein